MGLHGDTRRGVHGVYIQDQLFNFCFVIMDLFLYEYAIIL